MSFPPIHRTPLLSSQDVRARIPAGSRSRRSKANPDQAIRETDTDASIARISAVSKGYIHDEFARLFVPTDEVSIRPPWVNIGTHHRAYAIDQLVEKFISGTKGPRQVLSLGCGSDSRYWRLKQRWGENWPVERWVETDFEETVTRKLETIMKYDQLRSSCGGQIKLSIEDGPASGAEEPIELHGHHYSLLSADLRQPEQLVGRFGSTDSSASPLLKTDAATLIIAELVFVYMLPEQTESCLRQLNAFFGAELMVITYEALNLNDNFSRMMVQNLAARGLTLLGFNHNNLVESQYNRFRNLNFTEIVSTDMRRLREADGDDEQWKTLWKVELERIKRLEFLDEVEELELVLEHYALTWAIRSGNGQDLQGTKKQGFYLPHFT